MALDPQVADDITESNFLDISDSEAAEYKSEVQTSEYKHQRKLMAIAKRLTKKDMDAIAHNVHMKIQLSSMQNKNPCANELLYELEKKGIFTLDNTEPLRDILIAINRCDIVGDILPSLGSSPSQPIAVPSQSTQAILESEEARQELVTSFGNSWLLIRGCSATNLSITNREQKEEKVAESNAYENNNVSTEATGDEVPVLSTKDKLIANGHSPKSTTKIKMLAGLPSELGSDGNSSDTDGSQKSNDTNSTSTKSTELSAHELEMPESIDSVIQKSGATIINKSLDRVKLGKYILRHRVNTFISHQHWCIKPIRCLCFVHFKVKNEFYPYGLGEDEGNHATLKMIITPKIIEKSSFFLYKHSITFYVTVVTDSSPLEQLLVTDEKTIEIHAGHNIALYFRLLEHNKHIVKLKNKSFNVSVHAEVNVQRINLTSEDVEDNFTKIDATI